MREGHRSKRGPDGEHPSRNMITNSTEGLLYCMWKACMVKRHSSSTKLLFMIFTFYMA